MSAAVAVCGHQPSLQHSPVPLWVPSAFEVQQVLRNLEGAVSFLLSRNTRTAEKQGFKNHWKTLLVFGCPCWARSSRADGQWACPRQGNGEQCWWDLAAVAMASQDVHHEEAWWEEAHVAFFLPWLSKDSGVMVRGGPGCPLYFPCCLVLPVRVSCRSGGGTELPGSHKAALEWRSFKLSG